MIRFSFRHFGCCLLTALMMLQASAPANAQRHTDTLGRGLVAVKNDKGVYVSWRILADEYYDVEYNLYRDGIKVNAKPLNVSNYTDAEGSLASKYTVAPVVRGVEKRQSAAVTVWKQNYKEIVMPTVIGHDGTDITSKYSPNDICLADVDGDGEVELIVKRINQEDIDRVYPDDYKDFTRIDVVKQDGTLLWWIDVGPNMFSPLQEEVNAVAYDWDQDGKAEVLFRAEDGTVIHTANGESICIGDMTANYRPSILWRTANNSYETYGNEQLLYINGATGELYDQMDYPLPRGEINWANKSMDWGNDNYGHRANKHFYGAPFLDGLHPSILVTRGIYQRIDMITFDVDSTTHKLNKRWYWTSGGSGPYYAMGFHNFSINDVDWDGRDEIVYGSMCVDDNGQGLSSTYRGHGDAQHTGDLDPYRWGEESFTCHEYNPGSQLRNTTTSELYYTVSSSRDDGRCMAGNFSNDYPGSLCTSSRSGGFISSVTGQWVADQDWTVTQNFRIYWDGDLCEESFNYGRMSEDGYSYGADPYIIKYGTNWSDGAWYFGGMLTCNSTKGTPCVSGDLLGDWREEVVLRDSKGNLRIYTTTEETPWRNYSLWYDHDYRNAMVWQPCGYNQPPHTSYFLGELEGITVAPPPLTKAGRTEIANGGTIGTTNEHLLLCETNDMTVSVTEGASPYIVTDNAPSWTQGSNYYAEKTCAAGITTDIYTHTLKGGAFTGATRLVKQGSGVLVLPDVTETYTGNTDVWAGTLQFNGTMQSSPVWLNRFASLATSGTFLQPVKADYAASILPGGKGKIGKAAFNDLQLGFGSRIVIDVDPEGNCDQLNIKKLSVEKKDWENGPQYNTPVIELNSIGGGKIQNRTYQIGTVETIDGDLDDFVVDGCMYGRVYLEGNKIMIDVVSYYEKKVYGVAPAAGDFYIYNVEKGKYLDGSNPGLLSDSKSQIITLAGNDGQYSMKDAHGYIKLGYWDNVYAWTDGNDAVKWTISPVEGEDGVYTISMTAAISENSCPNSSKQTWFLCYDGTQLNATTDAIDATARWKFINDESAILAETGLAKYRIENGLPVYDSTEEGMSLDGWITKGTSTGNNCDNLWYLESGSLVKWGENRTN